MLNNKLLPTAVILCVLCALCGFNEPLCAFSPTPDVSALAEWRAGETVSQEAVAAYGDRIAVGVDAKDGEVRTSGWEAGSGVHFVDFARQMEQLGVKTLIFTDIDTDGMLSGPNYESLGRLSQVVSCQIVASGGVSCNEDLAKLQEMGLYGAIIGKAYYAGTVDLPKAVAAAGSQDNP
jgi:phosphoribosylformimino-5-aminoimidazole carboxamide ribotide isomerase